MRTLKSRLVRIEIREDKSFKESTYPLMSKQLAGILRSLAINHFAPGLLIDNKDLYAAWVTYQLKVYRSINTLFD